MGGGPSTFSDFGAFGDDGAGGTGTFDVGGMPDDVAKSCSSDERGDPMGDSGGVKKSWVSSSSFSMGDESGGGVTLDSALLLPIVLRE